MQDHRDIFQIIAWIKADPKRAEKYNIADNFNPEMARRLFTHPTVKRTGFDLNWQPVDQQGLKDFLTEKDFSANRIVNWLDKAVNNNY